jgi:D-alanyl-D-alanine carboxypeptidase
MGHVTVPRPPEFPLSRRATRVLREEADRRAPGTPEIPAREPHPTTLPLPIVATAGHDDAQSAAHVPLTRRAARAAELLSAVDAVPVQHARPRRAVRVAVSISIAAAGALLLGSTAAMTAMMADPPTAAMDAGDGSAATVRVDAAPMATVSALPVPLVEQAAATADICQLPEVVEALGAGDDEGVITAAGGGEAFRTAVVEGDAPCISLSDPARTWVVINKTRPYDPIDYRPAALVLPDDVRSVEGGWLRPDAASALTKMAAAAHASGVGEIALQSGFRSYSTQQSSYGSQVASRGVAGADLVSARPGFSEHQSGITGDIIACNGGCGTLDDLASSPQGAWLLDHSWEFGWITRYEDGYTATTGYLPEPWHMRFLGPELARAYHAGEWRTLEDFFGLPPAPDYVG